jgi:hypothetical protein
MLRFPFLRLDVDTEDADWLAEHNQTDTKDYPATYSSNGDARDALSRGEPICFWCSKFSQRSLALAQQSTAPHSRSREDFGLPGDRFLGDCFEL